MGDVKPRPEGQTEKEEPAKEAKNMPHEAGECDIPEAKKRETVKEEDVR